MAMDKTTKVVLLVLAGVAVLGCCDGHESLRRQ